ncbi:MAG: M48 family metallopeptidase [Candidatus Omnitrophota bacterium]|jgi:STE24 endopeptidase
MIKGSASPRSKKYSALKTKFFIADIFLTVAALVFFQLAFSRFLSGALTEAFASFYLACLVYIVLFLAFMYVISFPLHLADSFFVEHRFGLSSQKFTSWALDEMKQVLLSFALWIGCTQVFYLILRNFPNSWWLISALFWIFFSVILSRILPVLIIPLFFKYIPIEDRELKERIFSLAENAQIRLLDVCKIDFSRKTKKANAALVGLGRTRKVILADTLTDEFTPDEVETVVAHEFAHCKYRHIWKLLFFSGITTAAGFYVLFLAAKRIVELTGARGIDDLYIFPVLVLLMIAAGLVILPVHNLFSRFLEKEADRFALSLSRDPETFISVMEKLASMNLADMDPSRWKKIFLYDHPPIRERIQMAEDINKNEKQQEKNKGNI